MNFNFIYNKFNYIDLNYNSELDNDEHKAVIIIKFVNFILNKNYYCSLLIIILIIIPLSTLFFK